METSEMLATFLVWAFWIFVGLVVLGLFGWVCDRIGAGLPGNF